MSPWAGPSAPGRIICIAVAFLLTPPLCAAGQGSSAAPLPLPTTSLVVRAGDGWTPWWTSSSPPSRWRQAHPVVDAAVRWEGVGRSVERAALEVGVDGAPWRFHVILTRFDPRAHTLRLRTAVRSGGLRGAWTIDSAGADAVVALNAGQFVGGRSWGWLVQEGTERQPPGRGPLASSVVVDADGSLRILDPAGTDSARSAGGVAEAFQSYPTLLAGDGGVPEQLRAAGRGVDVRHRDARLALCTLRDGRALIALTRLAGVGGASRLLPIGPTTPEMAALMGALGCARAVMLDGGLSSQLLLREDGGELRSWPGLRRVPLGLEVLRKQQGHPSERSRRNRIPGDPR